MSNLFTNAFFRVINEADIPPVPATAPIESDEMSDVDAMKSTLDPGTNPDDFDINAGSREASIAAAKSHALMVDRLKTWVDKMTEFSEFLNGQRSDSVQSTLSKADEKTLFGTIKNAETKKIALVAKELAGLNEMMKGYLATSNDPKYKGI